VEHVACTCVHTQTCTNTRHPHPTPSNTHHRMCTHGPQPPDLEPHNCAHALHTRMQCVLSLWPACTSVHVRPPPAACARSSALSFEDLQHSASATCTDTSYSSIQPSLPISSYTLLGGSTRHGSAEQSSFLAGLPKVRMMWRLVAGSTNA